MKQISEMRKIEMYIDSEYYDDDHRFYPDSYHRKEFVILPMHSLRLEDDGKNQWVSKYVHETTGLNQWNAGGRERDPGEIYIPVPRDIHRLFPGFFPPRDQLFQLITPSNDIFTARLCQDGSKALMTNPNKALFYWVLRRLLRLTEGELLTYDWLLSMGVDSVIIAKESDGRYFIEPAGIDAYEYFMEDASN